MLSLLNIEYAELKSIAGIVNFILYKCICVLLLALYYLRTFNL